MKETISTLQYYYEIMFQMRRNLTTINNPGPDPILEEEKTVKNIIWKTINTKIKIYVQ